MRINAEGYTVSHWGASVSVVSEDVGGARWRNHVHGVTRETEFGSETIVVDGARTEKFLTVTERQGEKTWRWKLATRLVPRLGDDGAVSFADTETNHVTSLVIDPVQILDRSGKEITPEGLSWELEKSDTGWWLTLDLDDSEFPLPYVIDPAVSYRTSQTANNGAGSTSLTINVPAGVTANDLLVAHVAVRGNGAITAPGGWTPLVDANNGNFIRQATYYRIAGGSEPASYQWTFASTPAAGGMSAFYGVKSTSPVDVTGTTQVANSATVTAPSVTTAANDALVLAFFAVRASSAFDQAGGMTELYESSASGGVAAATDSMAQATAGATGAKTSTVTSGRNIGHQVAFDVDDAAPSVMQTDPGTPLAGIVSLAATASDADSAVAQVQFQRSRPARARGRTWARPTPPPPTPPPSIRRR